MVYLTEYKISIIIITIVDMSVICVTDDISNYDDGDISITVVSLIRVI